MTWYRATRLVAARELREAFRRKSLWIVFAVLFVGSSVAMILPDALDEGTTTYDVALEGSAPTTTSAGFTRDLRAAATHLDANVRFRTVANAARARALVDDGTVDIAVVGDDPATVVVRKGDNATLVALARQALATSALTAQLDQSGLDRSTIDRILTAPEVRIDAIAADESDRKASAAILSLVLYLILLLLMIQVASGVAIEKANRISEVLLAVVKPTALFFGKVVGVGLVGLAGLAAGGIPVVVKAITSGDLPAGLGPAIVGGLPWMVLGLALYLTTAGALGALGGTSGGSGIGAHAAQPPAHRDLRAGAELGRRQLRRGARDLPVHVTDRDAGAARARRRVGGRDRGLARRRRRDVALRPPSGRGRLPARHRAHRTADAAG